LWGLRGGYLSHVLISENFCLILSYLWGELRILLFRDKISILSCCISLIKGFKASEIAYWKSAIWIAFWALFWPAIKKLLLTLGSFFVGFQSFRGESSTSLNSKLKALFVKTSLTVLTLVGRYISCVLSVLITVWVVCSRRRNSIASKKPSASISFSIENRGISTVL
jgi:hypothetical protein